MARSSDPTHPAARAVRAARAYAHMSRAQLGERAGVGEETIGRYERGEWKQGPPRGPTLEAIARASGILDLVEWMASIESEPDPARRFAAAARQEARQRDGRPASEPAAHRDEDAGGEVR